MVYVGTYIYIHGSCGYEYVSVLVHRFITYTVFFGALSLFFKLMMSTTHYPFAHQESKPPCWAVWRCWRLYHFIAFALEDGWRSGQLVLIKIPGSLILGVGVWESTYAIGKGRP